MVNRKRKIENQEPVIANGDKLWARKMRSRDLSVGSARMSQRGSLRRVSTRSATISSKNGRPEDRSLESGTIDRWSDAILPLPPLVINSTRRRAPRVVS